MSLQLSGMSHGRDKELPLLLEQLMEMLIEHTFGYILHCNLRQKAKLSAELSSLDAHSINNPSLARCISPFFLALLQTPSIVSSTQLSVPCKNSSCTGASNSFLQDITSLRGAPCSQLLTCWFQNISGLFK